MPTLIVEGPTYYSPGDEAAFFEWLRKIPSIQSVGGRLRDVHIETVPDALPDDDLRELIGILRRYGMDMRGLAQFETKANARWFKSPATFWHEAVFRGPPSC